MTHLSDGESGDEEYEEELDSGKNESDNENLDEKSNSWQTIQFISDDQRGGSWNLPPPMLGEGQNHTVCSKGGSRKSSVVATKISHPQAINNDRSLMENVNKQRRHFISLSELRYGP